jgi:hypothetical protein
LTAVPFRRKLDLDDLDSVCSYFKIKTGEKIYFHQTKPDKKKAFDIVNELLVPYGFEVFSEGQFKRIAGGSAHSSNKIRNYASGYGKISYGYTRIEDIVGFCKEVLKNSVFVPLRKVMEQFEWAKTAINKGYITRYSGGGERYDIEAMIDIAKGMMPEVAFQMDAKENFGCQIDLDREFYGGPLETDEGWDVAKVKEGPHWRDPKLKVQIKDVQYFLLVPVVEFYGTRSADLYVAYRTHWSKAYTAQRFLRALGGIGEQIFDDFPPLEGIRVERRGWAEKGDFKHLPPRKNYKGLNFTADNMFVYWDDLGQIQSFPFTKL